MSAALPVVQTDFERALAVVLSFEGSKADNPHDKGGRTNRGITQRTYDGWREDKGLGERDVFLLEEDELQEIYRTLYWWPAQKLPWPLCLVVFDTAVLFGPTRATSWLAAVEWGEASAQAMAWAILCFRRERHREVVARDKTQARFLNGWMNRLNALATATLQSEPVLPENVAGGPDGTR